MKNVIETRVKGIGYTKNCAGNWQFVDIDQSNYNGAISRIGEQYKSKIELLSDLRNFAEIRGY